MNAKKLTWRHFKWGESALAKKVWKILLQVTTASSPKRTLFFVEKSRPVGWILPRKKAQCSDAELLSNFSCVHPSNLKQTYTVKNFLSYSLWDSRRVLRENIYVLKNMWIFSHNFLCCVVKSPIFIFSLETIGFVQKENIWFILQ